MYGAWNVYKAFMSNIDTNKLALMILNKLSIEDQKKIFNELGAEQELKSLPYQNQLQEFKQHKISISQLLQSIADSFINE